MVDSNKHLVDFEKKNAFVKNHYLIEYYSNLIKIITNHLLDL